MEYKRLSSLMSLCILVTTSQYVLTTQGSGTNECCFKEERKDIIGLITVANAINEAACNKSCDKGSGCFGFSWVSNISDNRYDECIIYATLKQINSWKLINCADDSLPYCWKLMTDVHQTGGVQQRNISDEDDCKRICVSNNTCSTVVWNVKEKQCWILYYGQQSPIKEHKNRINYWTIVRDVPRNFPKSSGSYMCPSGCELSMTLASDGSNSTTSDTRPTHGGIASTEYQPETKVDAIALGVLLGASTLFIIGLSIYAVKLKKRVPATSCSAPKVVEVKVTEEVKEVDEEKHDDDESYIDYQDLRKIDNGNTYEEACEYTAMELEEMKLREDDDDVYCNEDQ